MNKPFPPSQRKLDNAFKQGQVLRSSKGAVFFSTLGIVLGIHLTGPFISVGFHNLIYLRGDQRNIEAVGNGMILTLLVALILPLLMGSVLGNAIEIFFMRLSGAKGPLFRWSLIAPKMRFSEGISKIGKGFRNCVYILGLMFVMIGGFGLLCFNFLQVINAIIKSSLDDVFCSFSICSLVWSFLYQWSSLLLSGLFIVGVTHFCREKRNFVQSLSMDRNEVERENREEYGDPSVLSERRAHYHTLTYEDVIQRVRKAKTIIISQDACGHSMGVF